MDNTKKINRKEFLSMIPLYAVKNMHSLLNKKFIPKNADDEKTQEHNFSNKTAANVVLMEKDCCLAWAGGSCQYCYLSCHLRDTAIILYDQKPVINSSFCDGCAKCITACRTVNDRPALRIISSKT